MVSFKILAGGFDVFVATYLFNSDAATLTLQSKSPTGNNPSWITLNPTNRSLLYAVNSVSSGAIQSYTINADGSLSTPIDTVPSGGSNPAFVAALSTGEVAVMNYASGDGKILSTVSQESKFNPDAPLITFPTKAGTLSHPHMALEHNHEVLVPDLGQDTIWRLKRNVKLGTYSIQGSIPQPKGSGPRHIAIFKDRLFTLHELSSTLAVQTIPPPPNGTSTTFATVSIIPSNSTAGALWAASEILIPRPSKRFPTPYIYVSNRNKGNQTALGDSIAIFEHVNHGRPNEGLVLVKQVFPGLHQIRGMEFGSQKQGCEEFLIAGGDAGSTGGGVVMLRRTEGGRNLETVARNTDIPSRSTFVWI